jgi:cobaltochelatase CobN
MVRNNDVPSIREAVCEILNLDLDDLIENPTKTDENGFTNLVHLDNVDKLANEIFDKFAENDYNYKEISNEYSSPKLTDVLSYIEQRVLPKLEATTDEIKYFKSGIRGRFIPPGPSGAPSRGNADILPTGRNFYMIDPGSVPNRTSWETGKRLGDDMLSRYLTDNDGTFPENVAIVVYSGETIKTNGDDVAEIMYLYGVRPVWVDNTSKVVGLEVIPMEELRRPRIDVTLRISGLFRDTFPNLIERIEDAVNLVATLDESPEDNFVKKHVDSEVLALTAEGLEIDEAVKLSKLRIFGCPPGTYGAGVDILVNSKKWETTEDLGTAYITWGGHAYGREIHGEKMQQVFARRLSKADVTIKNISSYETDMLDSDDFYNYHGGLISAVKKESGVFPTSYSTNAADINHVQTRTIHEDSARIFRARINNPKWIEGLKQHGYAGAAEFSSMVDIVFGWDASTDVIDDWMYDSIADTYLLDEELREWIRENNPYALHQMSERLLEANSRGMWETDQERLDFIQDLYLEMEGEMEEA